MFKLLVIQHKNFPSFSEGLSLRAVMCGALLGHGGDFPSFSEGLSLRDEYPGTAYGVVSKFPFLFGGTFIEGRPLTLVRRRSAWISLPFRRDFH